MNFTDRGPVKLAVKRVQLAIGQITGQSEGGGKGGTCREAARRSGACRQLLRAASVGCRGADVSSNRRRQRAENCAEVLTK